MLSQMEINMLNRNQAIKQLNEYYDDLISPFSGEHRLIVESHISGFNMACKVLDIFTEDEFDQVENSLKNFVITGIKPAFLAVTEVGFSISDAKKYVHEMADNLGRHLDTALDSLNELISQKIEFPTAIGLVLDEYKVDQTELTAAYDSQ
jgi:hypothetical protein